MALIIFSQLSPQRNLFIIVDEDKISLHETYESDAALALNEAGIQIGRNDVFSVPSAPLRGGVTQVVIKRSVVVTIVADGLQVQLLTQGDTVGAVLDRYGLPMGPLDEVSPTRETPVTDGMVITVSRIATRIITVAEPIPYETVRTASKELMVDTERVDTPGVPGEKACTYQVTLRDGVEVSRQLSAEFVITPPKSEQVTYGTGGTITTPSGEVLRYKKRLEVTATAYTTEGHRNKRTYSGTIARVGAIAVDPKVIPLGSRLYIEALNGSWVYGVAVAEDTGGVIKGNKIDLFFNTEAECYKFGVKKAVVYVLK